ncbi:MAG TPA: DUF885 domain-containing protein [Casimicrobiaceae bacterium]
MRNIRTPVLLFAATLWLFAWATASAQSPSEKAHALFDAYSEWQLRELPGYATAVGDHRYDDRLTDFSEAAIAGRNAFVVDLARQLQGIDRNALVDQDRVSFDMLATVVDFDLGRFAVFSEPDAARADLWLSVNQFNGPQIGFAGLPALIRVSRFNSVLDYENYLKRLGAVPAQLEQLTGGLRRAVARGWLPPRVVVQRVPSQIDALLAADVTASPLYAPFERFPGSFSPADRERLAAMGRAALADKVFPAFRALRQFYVAEYMPACSEEPSAAARPSWAKFYAAQVASQTTTSLTPREIHDLGLKEVERIGREMDAVAKHVGFNGTRKQFADWIKSAPEFHYSNAAEMLAGYRDIAKRVEPELPRLFAELPRLPFGIRAMDAAEGDNAEKYTRGTADGTRPGYFEANVNNVSRRAKGDMVTLLLHEGVPGHHLQSARALELKDLPAFRRRAFLPAYGEGWALYAESLGKELGLYDDPYAEFGYLSSEMLRACRLVVDTGIHAFGWKREQAIRYLVDNSGITEEQAIAEIDRYYVWPGQALAYKIGELKIKALRARAQAALGERFDIRRFHNALIDDGALPLAVLEQRIDEWIARDRP